MTALTVANQRMAFAVDNLIGRKAKVERELSRNLFGQDGTYRLSLRDQLVTQAEEITEQIKALEALSDDEKIALYCPEATIQKAHEEAGKDWPEFTDTLLRGSSGLPEHILVNSR